jgi:holo-ACP synthase CitX
MYEKVGAIETDGACGPELLILLPRCREPEKLKLLLVGIEETHPLGRLFDLDLNFGREDSSFGRSDAGIEPRSCFICGKPAALCARSAAHSPESIENYLRELYAGYFTSG